MCRHISLAGIAAVAVSSRSISKPSTDAEKQMASPRH
jgi:hypothetical protein